MRHVAICFALLLSVAPVHAQVGGTGAIQGTVTDPTGALVAGATVTAVNSATAVQSERKTAATGVFLIPLLPPGDYTVSFKAAGFQTRTQTHVVVDALDTVGLNTQLQLGEANQSVTVDAQASILKADDAALGSTMENQ